MDSSFYPAFFRRGVRNMMVGTLLSVLPAGPPNRAHQPVKVYPLTPR